MDGVEVRSLSPQACLCSESPSIDRLSLSEHDPPEGKRTSQGAPSAVLYSCKQPAIQSPPKG